MSDLERSLQDPALIRKVHRRYFRDEPKYDSWGAQGKVLVILETLREAGYIEDALSAGGIDLERMVNAIFPRTFALSTGASIPEGLVQAVRERYTELKSDLSDYIVDPSWQHRILCEETAANLNLPVEQVEQFIDNQTAIRYITQRSQAGPAKGEEITMYRFLVVIEKANGNYSAYSPDLPGCVATGKTREEAERNIHEAIELHVRGLMEDNLPIPQPESFAEYVAIQK